ncbi:hypothetical protein KO527_06065 [Pseudoalteromonas sp. C2R02]|uniref:hypothetical protein n=1 Tax=Pseudoalteromonas sp. C2R02 TaxID=2841565 RepID=UPI001C096D52|nr:hypothetical protein [Pseudoalteromonas sp. C2R02]MBU2968908.1 hypothetical protein [Pseudoalteromonas sp. C2R02]
MVRANCNCAYFFLLLGTTSRFTRFQLADSTVIISLLFKVVMFSVILMSVSFAILTIINYKNAKKSLDEREALIELRGSYYSNWILKVGVVIAVAQYALESNAWAIGLHQNIPFLPLHILVLAFLLSEFISCVKQVRLFRKGV